MAKRLLEDDDDTAEHAKRQRVDLALTALQQVTLRAVKTQAIPLDTALSLLDLPEDVLVLIGDLALSASRSLLLTTRWLQRVTYKTLGDTFVRLVREGVERLKQWGGWTWGEVSTFVGPLSALVTASDALPLAWFAREFGDRLGYPAMTQEDVDRIYKLWNGKFKITPDANGRLPSYFQCLVSPTVIRKYREKDVASLWSNHGHGEWHAVYWLLVVRLPDRDSDALYWTASDLVLQLLIPTRLRLHNKWDALNFLSDYWWHFEKKKKEDDIWTLCYRQNHPNDPAPTYHAYAFPTTKLYVDYEQIGAGRNGVSPIAEALPTRPGDPQEGRDDRAIFLPLTTYSLEALYGFLTTLFLTLVVKKDNGLQEELFVTVGSRLLDSTSDPKLQRQVLYRLQQNFAALKNLATLVAKCLCHLSAPHPPDKVFPFVIGLCHSRADAEVLLTHSVVLSDGRPIIDPWTPLAQATEFMGFIDYALHCFLPPRLNPKWRLVYDLFEYVNLRGLFYVLEVLRTRNDLPTSFWRHSLGAEAMAEGIYPIFKSFLSLFQHLAEGSPDGAEAVWQQVRKLE